MSRTSRTFSCPPEQVFDVLADGWLYPSWVVGASRMRDVDADWPMPGSRLHHSVGSWPVLIDDTTVVKAYDPPHRLELTARAWPTGEAEVLIEVSATPGGCVVTITEDAVKGPATLMPKPLRTPLLTARNRETLQRLALLAQGGAR